MRSLDVVRATKIRSVSVKEIPWYPDWVVAAECRNYDPDIFYDYGRSTVKINRAKAVCQQCPVRMQCLKANLLVPHGIFGGYTYLERYRLVYGGNATPSRGLAFSYFEHVYLTSKGDLKSRSTVRRSPARKYKKSSQKSRQNSAK